MCFNHLFDADLVDYMKRGCKWWAKDILLNECCDRNLGPRWHRPSIYVSIMWTRSRILFILITPICLKYKLNIFLFSQRRSIQEILNPKGLKIQGPQVVPCIIPAACRLYMSAHWGTPFQDVTCVVHACAARGSIILDSRNKFIISILPYSTHLQTRSYSILFLSFWLRSKISIMFYPKIHT
jgi:hypothetical protein